MANWNYGGYTAPSSVTSKDDVRNLQRQLGVTADGLWGPKTQAAYEASGMANQQSSGPASSVPSGYSTYLKDFQSLLGSYAPTISYTPASREELQQDISSYLRPAYDLAIQQRKDATVANKANIDVDAASRGMGSSTWVTDVKDRAQDSEARDIATLESQYAGALAQQLMSALQQEKANQLAVDQYNASSQAQALQTALGLAGDFYANDLAMAQRVKKGGPGGPPDVELTEIEKMAADLIDASQDSWSNAMFKAQMKASKATNAADRAKWNDVFRILEDEVFGRDRG